MVLERRGAGQGVRRAAYRPPEALSAAANPEPQGDAQWAERQRAVALEAVLLGQPEAWVLEVAEVPAEDSEAPHLHAAAQPSDVLRSPSSPLVPLP